jgi:hypothetical protein
VRQPGAARVLCVDVAAAAFECLSRMIEEMLFIAKADNPATVIECAPVELRNEVDEVVEFYSSPKIAGCRFAPPARAYCALFERFYRADTARQNSSEGSGLGLAIVKSIAILHGGDARVGSVPGSRTTCVLTLPQHNQPIVPRTGKSRSIQMLKVLSSPNSIASPMITISAPAMR